jgi:hypothetical protein
MMGFPNRPEISAWIKEIGIRRVPKIIMFIHITNCFLDRLYLLVG